ncbi:entry exclusion protein TrbK [Ensifer sp. ZNC0028]|nr:entry exclusion protein TrbK [Ensifer sp. ZNC0028]
MTTTVFILRSSCEPVVSDEQRATQDRFFGSSNELPPIEKGQEMKPRW